MNQNGETTQQDVVTKEELKGFYSFTVATEGYSAMALAVFFPLILKTLTAEVAFERNDHSIPCDTSSEVHCDALFFGRYIDTSSAVLYSTSISVLLQFLLFTTLGILVLKLGSLADYGPRRLQFMIGFSVVTAIVGGLISAVVDESLYLVAYLIYIVSNTTFGASFVFLYAWIPVLTKASKEVIEADNDPCVSDDEFYVISDRVANTISSRSFFVGYIAAVCQLIVSAGIVVLAGDGTKWGLPKTYPMQICITAICIWQLIIIFSYTKRLMKPRPGPLLPKGENYFTFSLKNCKLLSNSSGCHVKTSE
jgi:UMF1 family MFS transporter